MGIEPTQRYSRNTTTVLKSREWEFPQLFLYQQFTFYLPVFISVANFTNCPHLSLEPLHCLPLWQTPDTKLAQILRGNSPHWIPRPSCCWDGRKIRLHSHHFNNILFDLTKRRDGRRTIHSFIPLRTVQSPSPALPLRCFKNLMRDAQRAILHGWSLRSSIRD